MMAVTTDQKHMANRELSENLGQYGPTSAGMSLYSHLLVLTDARNDG